MRQLRDRVAVVTGGGSGIGEAIARACAAEGMRVVVADIEAAAADRVSEDLRKAGAQALGIRVDVTDPASVASLAKGTYDALGDCHLLVNNAGVVVMGSLATRSSADWEWVLGVNVRGTAHCLEAFLPRMLEAGGERHVVNTGSINGLCAFPIIGVYVASKYAIVGLSESLRQELAPAGIGVSVLCPGAVKTRLLDADRNRPAPLGQGSLTDEDIAAVSEMAGDDTETAMDPVRVAAAVIEGVREDAAYIITHPEMRGLVEARHTALLAAFDRAERRTG